MPRSSRGCSFFRCEEKSVALCRTEDGRVKTFAKKSGYHAAVPRILRGATSGASGGDSPMSESSRTARRRSVGGFGTELRLGEGARYSDIRARWWCGCRARRDGESVRRADGRLQGAQFVCAPANRGPVGVAPTSTTTTLPPQPCRFTDGECRGQCGGDGVCSAAASSGSCECRTTPSGRTRPRATASAPTRARRASSISRARAACAFRRRGRSARRERSKRRETPLAAPPAGFIRGHSPSAVARVPHAEGRKPGHEGRSSRPVRRVQLLHGGATRLTPRTPLPSWGRRCRAEWPGPDPTRHVLQQPTRRTRDHEEAARASKPVRTRRSRTRNRRPTGKLIPSSRR